MVSGDGVLSRMKQSVADVKNSFANTLSILRSPKTVRRVGYAGLALVGAGGFTASLTGCGSNIPNGPQVTVSGPQTPGTGTASSSSSSQPDLDGKYQCDAVTDSGTVGYDFYITNGRFGSQGQAPLVVKDNQVSWTDTFVNPSGWDVTLNLNNGSINGASGSYVNNYSNEKHDLTNCGPYSNQ